MVIFKKIILALAVFGICYGVFFKIHHYPGASFLLLVGAVALMINIVLSMVWRGGGGEALKIFSSSYSRSTQMFIGIGGAVLCLGILFKIQHYPGTVILSFIGWNMFAISLIIRTFSTPKNKKAKVDISEFGQKESE